MKTQLSVKTFDYSALDKDTKSKLIWFANEICKSAQSHAKAGLEMGRMLVEARELCKTKKDFEAWVAAECRCSARSAYNYISAHVHFGSCATVAQIELGAMYALTTSVIAKNRAIKLADKGITVTQAMAKKLVKDAKPKKPPKTPPKASGSDSTTDAPEVAVTVANEPGTGKCPNCGKTKWEEDEEGVFDCKACRHPWGEPAGDVDDNQFKLQKRKTIGYLEYAMRDVDTLNDLKSNPRRDEAIKAIQSALKIVKEWKQ